jgi:type II secretory pathway component GspD/PulD (secretin)
MKLRNMFVVLFSLFLCLLPVMRVISADIVQGKPVTLNASENDIRNILTGLAKANDVNLIMSNSVQGKISINLTDAPFFEAIQHIAKSAGFDVEQYDKTIVIAKPDEMKNLLPETTKTIALKYISANDVKQTLSGIPLNGVTILADQRTNVIIATGIENNIQKLEGLIKLLDVPVSDKAQVDLTTKLFPLKYARANAVQQTVTSFCSSSGKVIMDDRTNTLIITDQASNLEKLSEIITQLDIQTEEEKQKIIQAQQPPPTVVPLLTQVFILNHIEASAVSPVIQGLLSAAGKVQIFIKRKDIVVIETASSGSSSGGSSGGSSSLGSSSGMSNFYKEKWSDTLIVTDTPDAIEKVAALITELDTKSIQIKIEAKIVEVNMDNADDLGISWGATHKPSGATIAGTFPAYIGRGIDANVGTLSTDHFENIKIQLQAMESKGQANLVSNPSVISMDNELAQMMVADKIPIAKTYETQFSSTTGFEFISVGVMLNVVPHITEDGYILMDTMPIVDSIKQWVGADNSQPVVSSRVAHCRVRVKDGETIAIGGLMKEEKYNSSEHVPWLGRIPLLGKLFGYNTSSKTKTDLIIFITPKILKDGSE